MSTVNSMAHVVKLHPGYKKSDRNHQEPEQGEREGTEILTTKTTKPQVERHKGGKGVV